MRAALQSLLVRNPWLAVVAVVALLALLGVSLVRAEVRVPPHSAAQVGYLLLGAATLPALVFAVAKLVRKHVRSSALLAAALAAVLGEGLRLGLGWSRFGTDVHPATEHRGAQTFGAGVVLSVVLGGLAVVVVALRRVRDRPETAESVGTAGRDRPRSATAHPVTVFDVGSHDAQGATFLAVCDCGWVGPPRTASEEAFRDAREHSPEVDPTIARRVG